MRKWILAGIALGLVTGGTLAAQEPRFGLGFTVNVPTGALNSSTQAGATDTYNTTLGAQFTVSWPLSSQVALRLNVAGATFDGSRNWASGGGYNLQDEMLNVGGDLQIFLGQGSARRHVGAYLIGGLSADMERFTGSTDDPGFYPDYSVNRTRLGAQAGLGYSCPDAGRMRWTLEGVFHKTLTGTDASFDTRATPAADFAKLYVGFIF